jgi:hypothetical protein
MESPQEGNRDFQKIEKEILSLTETALPKFYVLYWRGVDLLKDVIKFLISEARAFPDQSSVTYTKVLLLLMNRFIQHTESSRLLLERGLYGDAATLSRSSMSDLMMAEYLFHHTELLEMFWNEKEDDYQKNRVFKDAFNEGAIDRDSVSRGSTPYGTAFKTLSKASHASAFGSQFFGSQSSAGNGQYHFNYGPYFEAKKALSFSTVILGGILDMLIAVFVHEENVGNGQIPDEWKMLEQDVLRFETDVHNFIDAAKATLRTLG